MGSKVLLGLMPESGRDELGCVKVVRELDEVRADKELHPRRRMVVMRRNDGHYTFAEQYYYLNEWEGRLVAEGWATLPPQGVYATAEAAEADALAAYSRWPKPD
jgi:hypothetical protein